VPAGSYLPVLFCPMCAWPQMACVNYWIISLWRERRSTRRIVTGNGGKMFTLQMLLDYDLEGLRLHKEL
jgi:hypothetical protein